MTAFREPLRLIFLKSISLLFDDVYKLPMINQMLGRSSLRTSLDLFALMSFLLLFSAGHARAEDGILAEFDAIEDTQYVLRLTNGDILTGVIIGFVSDPELGEGIQLDTELEIVTVYEYQIIEILPATDYYRHDHRIFVMPTARPIRDNHFVGSLEILFLYLGAGIADIVSITGGKSIVPTIPAEDQANLLNVKVTVYSSEADFGPGNISLAVGANWASVNDDNIFSHAYGVATFTQKRSSVTAIIFAKLGKDDFYTIEAGDKIDPFNVSYANGAVGVGLGLDTKFSQRHDVHFIGELWNSDVARPTNTSLLLGVRLANTDISADFGAVVTTQLGFGLITGFVWTPF